MKVKVKVLYEAGEFDPTEPGTAWVRLERYGNKVDGHFLLCTGIITGETIGDRIGHNLEIKLHYDSDYSEELIDADTDADAIEIAVKRYEELTAVEEEVQDDLNRNLENAQLGKDYWHKEALAARFNARELQEQKERLKQELTDEKLKRMADIDTRSYETAVDELAEAHKENKEANRIKNYWHKEAMYARHNAFKFRTENESLKSRIAELEYHIEFL